MTELIHGVFVQVPWLKTFMIWALAISVVVLVLALPAYYLLLPVTQRLRAAISRHLANAREIHSGRRRQRHEAEREFLEQYANDHLLRHLDATNSRKWARTRAALIKPLNEIQTMLVAATGSMDGFSKALPKLHERIEAITDTMPKDFDVKTNDPSLGHATGNLRVAR
jgi:hypothetical protein